SSITLKRFNFPLIPLFGVPPLGGAFGVIRIKSPSRPKNKKSLKFTLTDLKTPKIPAHRASP
ncbi:MAG TPA: hypothetical protein VH255_02275, partial [Verrucomicrobiae bacterium]|nr:hypothetical protein [Verrucomicrobiae bacterium]